MATTITDMVFKAIYFSHHKPIREICLWRGQLEIAKTVIRSLAVFVMDMLPRIKRSAQLMSHKITVLQNVLAPSRFVRIIAHPISQIARIYPNYTIAINLPTTSPVRMVFPPNFVEARRTADRCFRIASIALRDVSFLPTIITDTSDIEIMRGFASPNKAGALSIIPIYRHMLIILTGSGFVK